MAERLPFHVLVNIIIAARVGNSSTAFDHGGSLVRFDNLRTRFPLVCKAWHDAAVFTLHQRVGIAGGEMAQLFLRTLQERPERALFVRSLSVGLDSAQDAEPSTEEARLASTHILDVLEACTPLLLHLHVRPLHPSARPRLLAAIQSAPALTDLAVLPRLNLEDSPFQATDLLQLVTPTLERLELDAWAEPVPHPLPLPSFQSESLALTSLRISFTNGDAVVLALLEAAGPKLVSIDVYLEAGFESTDAIARALLPSHSTLRHLSYLNNPAGFEAHLDPNFERLFDRILPQFKHLHTLRTFTAEFSALNPFRLLPPSMRRLQLSAFDDSPTFHPTALLNSLTDHSIDVHLAELQLEDEGWEQDEVDAVADALAARGVAFTFVGITVDDEGV
ncbi:hypothetical protein RQP46_010675 [Phenoliferia psychrophenolica]